MSKVNGSAFGEMVARVGCGFLVFAIVCLIASMIL